MGICLNSMLDRCGRRGTRKPDFTLTCGCAGQLFQRPFGRQIVDIDGSFPITLGKTSSFRPCAKCGYVVAHLRMDHETQPFCETFGTVLATTGRSADTCEDVIWLFLAQSRCAVPEAKKCARGSSICLHTCGEMPGNGVNSSEHARKRKLRRSAGDLILTQS